jgi:hypothetical protein
MIKKERTLYLSLSADTSVGVGDTDVELLSALDNGNAVAGRDVVGNLGSKDTVVHHQQVQLGQVGNDELLEAGGHQVTGQLVVTITNLGHGNLTLETATNAVINTLGLSP